MNSKKHPLLDPNNWLNKTSKEVEPYKINIMLAFDVMYNLKDIDSSKYDYLNEVVSDIDVLAYLFSRYILQRDYCLEIPNIKKHLKNEEYAKHILKFGCVCVVTDAILKYHPKFKEDLNIFKMIDYKDEAIICAFENILKKDDNLDKILSDGQLNQHLLKIFPKNLKISQMLLEAGHFPSDYIRPFFNEEAFDNKKAVMRLFEMLNGYMYYAKLPEKLQYDPEICEAVLKNHPHTLVKVYNISNFNEWVELLANNKDPLKYELYSMIDSADRYKEILQSDDDVVSFFKLIFEQKSICYVDLMGGPIFSDHPIQKFTKKLSKKFKVAREFLKTDFGKNFVEYPIKNYSDFSVFESEQVPQVHALLNKCLLKIKLDEHLPKNKEKNKKTKNKI